jgi:hypothetical protein
MQSYLEHLRQELEEAIGAATASDMAQAPAGKWSAAQILEHLYLTYKGTNRILAKCVEGGTALATRSTLKQRFGAVMVLKLGHIPEGRTAPQTTVPKGMPPTEIRQNIFSELQKMGSSLDNCERKFGVRTKIVDHPVLGPLTANQWRKFHLIHGRHHLRQIRQRIGKS